MLGMVLLLERGYWDLVLELWLAARLHANGVCRPAAACLLRATTSARYVAPAPVYVGPVYMAIRTIEAIAANDLRQRGLG